MNNNVDNRNKTSDLLDKIYEVLQKAHTLSVEIKNDIEKDKVENITKQLEERQTVLEKFSDLENKLKTELRKENEKLSEEFKDKGLKIQNLINQIMNLDKESEKIMSGKKLVFLNELKTIDKARKMKKGYGNIGQSQSVFLDIVE